MVVGLFGEPYPQCLFFDDLISVPSPTPDDEVIQSPLGHSLAPFFPDVPSSQECAFKGCSSQEELAASDDEKDESGTLFSPMYQFFDSSGVSM